MNMWIIRVENSKNVVHEKNAILFLFEGNTFLFKTELVFEFYKICILEQIDFVTLKSWIQGCIPIKIKISKRCRLLSKNAAVKDVCIRYGKLYPW